MEESNADMERTEEIFIRLARPAKPRAERLCAEAHPEPAALGGKKVPLSFRQAGRPVGDTGLKTIQLRSLTPPEPVA
jgi:hypothetical protein